MQVEKQIFAAGALSAPDLPRLGPRRMNGQPWTEVPARRAPAGWKTAFRVRRSAAESFSLTVKGPAR
ncbi:hypothetical protein [Nocardia sp. NBC_00416]|uniref:hypothetical protein n=1 Tax=Nocardia sp. NBC_00416 TaxID=2975991 RepID=UPI002E1ECC21